MWDMAFKLGNDCQCPIGTVLSDYGRDSAAVPVDSESANRFKCSSCSLASVHCTLASYSVVCGSESAEFTLRVRNSHLPVHVQATLTITTPVQPVQSANLRAVQAWSLRGALTQGPGRPSDTGKVQLRVKSSGAPNPPAGHRDRACGAARPRAATGKSESLAA
jgi:hypothetical protein